MPYGASKSGSSYSGAGQSNVGVPSTYEAGNQRNEPQSVIRERNRYRDGLRVMNRSWESKDDRTLADKISSQGRYPQQTTGYHPEAELSKRDPTAPAILHGHEPSKGAKIDKELKAEDELRLQETSMRK